MVTELCDYVRMAHELPLKLKEATIEATKAEADKIRAEVENLRVESTGVSGDRE